MWWSWALPGPEGAMAGPQEERSVVGAVGRCQRHPGLVGSERGKGWQWFLAGGLSPALFASPRLAGKGNSLRWAHTGQGMSYGALLRDLAPVKGLCEIKFPTSHCCYYEDWAENSCSLSPVCICL